MAHQFLDQFSEWRLWDDKVNLPKLDLASPGIYALAISKIESLTNQPFSFRKEIVYFGMTNAKGGLRGRLNQFNCTFSKKSKKAHGGAERFRGKYKDNEIPRIRMKLYVSVLPFPDCDVKSPTASDLRRMGTVAMAEYECLAHYMDLHNHQLPEFNDKKRSLKRPRPKQNALGKR